MAVSVGVLEQRMLRIGEQLSAAEARLNDLRKRECRAESLMNMYLPYTRHEQDLSAIRRDRILTAQLVDELSISLDAAQEQLSQQRSEVLAPKLEAVCSSN